LQGFPTGAMQALGEAVNDILGLLEVWTEIKDNIYIYKKYLLMSLKGGAWRRNNGR
jgi:hypothetical protein